MVKGSALVLRIRNAWVYGELPRCELITELQYYGDSVRSYSRSLGSAPTPPAGQAVEAEAKLQPPDRWPRSNANLDVRRRPRGGEGAAAQERQSTLAVLT